MRFSKYFPITVCVPIAIIIIGLIVGIACGGMNLGIDFTGGTMMTIHMGGDFDSSVVAEAFVNEGFTEQQISVTPSARTRSAPTSKPRSVRLTPRRRSPPPSAWARSPAGTSSGTRFPPCSSPAR